MALDPVKNFAISRVATAPSPADSGTTLVVETGDGALFPDPSASGAYNVVIYPNGEQPTSTNAEIVRVTARTSDTMTITREQESTSARTVAEGDIVMLGITAKVVSDLSTAVTGVVTETGTQTLTNKTIDGDLNTIQDLPYSSIKGVAWTSFVPSWTNLTVGAGTNVGAYCQIGKTVHFWVKFILKSGSAVGAAEVKLTLPVTRASGYAGGEFIGLTKYLDAGTATFGGLIEVGGTLMVSASPMAYVATASPMTWTTNDTLLITGTYEAA